MNVAATRGELCVLAAESASTTELALLPCHPQGGSDYHRLVSAGILSLVLERRWKAATCTLHRSLTLSGRSVTNRSARILAPGPLAPKTANSRWTELSRGCFLRVFSSFAGANRLRPRFAVGRTLFTHISPSRSYFSPNGTRAAAAATGSRQGGADERVLCLAQPHPAPGRPGRSAAYAQAGSVWQRRVPALQRPVALRGKVR